MGMQNEYPDGKKVTLHTAMSWIFGVGFIVGGLFSPTTPGPACLILTICTGIFVLPPFQRMLRLRMRIELSTGACWGIVFVLLVSVGVVLSAGVQHASCTNPDVRKEWRQFTKAERGAFLRASQVRPRRLQ